MDGKPGRSNMPAREVMKKFRKHQLHSGRAKYGKKGKIVRSKKQAKAILLSYLRKEGKLKKKRGTKR